MNGFVVLSSEQVSNTARYRVKCVRYDEVSATCSILNLPIAVYGHKSSSLGRALLLCAEVLSE